MIVLSAPYPLPQRFVTLENPDWNDSYSPNENQVKIVIDMLGRRHTFIEEINLVRGMSISGIKQAESVQLELFLQDYVGEVMQIQDDVLGRTVIGSIEADSLSLVQDSDESVTFEFKYRGN